MRQSFLDASYVWKFFCRIGKEPVTAARTFAAVRLKEPDDKAKQAAGWLRLSSAKSGNGGVPGAVVSARMTNFPKHLA